jgi:site-specific DNA-methyltransferase (adenine-specific)
MSDATWYTGDSLETLKTLPAESVDLVITSPPFLALRSYLPADDPNKHLEMGSEATPGLFVDALMRVVEECRRVLAPHGSLCLELGDTYASEGDGWPLPKSLSLIPETVRFTMVYGRNPHTGRETPQWRLRNVVRWVRPNPPVGALGDKYRPATSELMVFAQGAKRFFDLDAVRQPLKDPGAYVPRTNEGRKGHSRLGTGQWHDLGPYDASLSAGAPPLDWWEIPTQPYRGAHYATWPKRLLDIPIRSMVPEKVCRVCGKPSERIREHLGQRRFKAPLKPHAFGRELIAAMTDQGMTVGALADHLGVTEWMIRHYRAETATPQLPSVERWEQISAILEFPEHVVSALEIVEAEYETEDRGNREIEGRLSGGPQNGDLPKVVSTGWSDCGHNDWRRGVVLDPFAGSGTTLEVATGHGRNAIGIDLDERNYHLALQRIGMFLTHA